MNRIKISPLVLMISILFHFSLNAYTIDKFKANGTQIKDYSCNRNKGEISFSYECENAGSYYLVLWQCATRLADSSYASYHISVNGVSSSTCLPQKENWNALRVPTPLSLNNGINRITISTPIPIVPNIERVECVPVTSATITTIESSKYYSKYFSKINRKLSNNYSESPIIPIEDTTINLSTRHEVSIYDYGVEKVNWYGYTFNVSVFFEKGQVVHLKSKALSSKLHFIHLFSLSNPSTLSKTSLSNEAGENELSVTIPESGIYKILLRTYKNNDLGLCSIDIDGKMFFTGVPITSSGIDTNIFSLNTNFNYFTDSSIGNPYLLLLEGSITDNYITNHDNDYTGTGMHEWGLESRIKTTFTNGGRKALFITSANSFFPEGKSLLYYNCKDAPIPKYMPDYSQDDALAACAPDTLYNCISWSGGITSYWEWPGDTISPYFSAKSEIDCFDNFYGSNRYPGCTLYIREETADLHLSEEIGVDLWGLRFKDTFNLLHGSICKNSDSNYHGYSWESKLGPSFRVFHPRHALAGINYGRVLFHYSPIEEGMTPCYSLEQSIADGRAIMEKCIFPEDILDYLENKIIQIPELDLDNFTLILRDLICFCNNSIISNPRILQESEKYKNLKTLLSSKPQLKYLLFRHIYEGNKYLFGLLEDVVSLTDSYYDGSLFSTVSRCKNIQYDSNGRQIIYSSLTNAKKIILAYLSREMETHPFQAPPASYNNNQTESNLSEWKISLNGSDIIIDFTITYSTHLSMDIININGQFLDLILKATRYAPGSYTIRIKKKHNGPILIRKSENGIIDVKRII